MISKTPHAQRAVTSSTTAPVTGRSEIQMDTASSQRTRTTTTPIAIHSDASTSETPAGTTPPDIYVVDARFDFGWTGTSDVVETLREEFHAFIRDQEEASQPQVITVTGPDDYYGGSYYRRQPAPRLTQVDGTLMPNGHWVWDGIFTMTAEVQAHSAEEALDILELAVMEFALQGCGDCWALMIR